MKLPDQEASQTLYWTLPDEDSVPTLSVVDGSEETKKQDSRRHDANRGGRHPGGPRWTPVQVSFRLLVNELSITNGPFGERGARVTFS